MRDKDSVFLETKQAKISYRKQRSKYMPVIHIQGYSLLDSGFEIGDHVSISLRKDMIIIKKEMPIGATVFNLPHDVQQLINRLSLVEI